MTEFDDHVEISRSSF